MKKFLLLVFICLYPVTIYGEPSADLFPHPFYQDQVIFVDKQTGEKRSDLTYTLTKTVSQGEFFFNLDRKGQGKRDQYTDITWETTAQLKEQDGFLYLLESLCVAKDKDGKIILQYEKEFDYERNVIHWRHRDAEGRIRKHARYPIKGRTTDDVTLMYFLKTYVANRHDPEYQTYYFLSNEPRLYKVNIRVMGQEVLDLAIGKKNAIKLKLTGDMGILDDILDRFVPHTYVWYEDAAPYEWLQYEGLETSMQSANVIAQVTERLRD